MYAQFAPLQWICIVLIILSGVFINITRNGKASPVKKEADKGTILLFRIIYPLGIVGAFSIQFWDNFSLLKGFNASTLAWVGTLLFIAGMSLRWTAILQLKHAFTVKISIIENHTLHTKGVYSIIRHPSYTGLMLYYAGLGLLLGNALSFLMLIGVNALVLTTRIQKEERVLAENFGSEWDLYVSKTYRLIPYIF